MEQVPMPAEELLVERTVLQFDIAHYLGRVRHAPQVMQLRHHFLARERIDAMELAPVFVEEARIGAGDEPQFPVRGRAGALHQRHLTTRDGGGQQAERTLPHRRILRRVVQRVPRGAEQGFGASRHHPVTNVCKPVMRLRATSLTAPADPPRQRRSRECATLPRAADTPQKNARGSALDRVPCGLGR
ncbi:MAG: hypothetical protein LKM39_01515 [Chiayiivirga sp.]|nr:hypothetical protein [Chiayiivirga sp.]